MAGIDVLDRELPALELVLALHRIGAGARHGDADEDRIALRAGRPGADRRLVLGPARRHQAERGAVRRSTGRRTTGARLRPAAAESPPENAPLPIIISSLVRNAVEQCSPLVGVALCPQLLMQINKRGIKAGTGIRGNAGNDPQDHRRAMGQRLHGAAQALRRAHRPTSRDACARLIETKRRSRSGATWWSTATPTASSASSRTAWRRATRCCATASGRSSTCWSRATWSACPAASSTARRSRSSRSPT